MHQHNLDGIVQIVLMGKTVTTDAIICKNDACDCRRTAHMRRECGNADGNNVLVITYMLRFWADVCFTTPLEEEYIRSDFSS